MFTTETSVLPEPAESPENSVGENPLFVSESYQSFSTMDTTTVSGVVYWLSKDPIGISGGLNLYVFCGNNPVNFVDPFGLCGEDPWTWFKPRGEDYAMGRPGMPIFNPSNPLMNGAENIIPGAHEFAQIHDAWVSGLTDANVPDAIANIPSMPFAYIYSIGGNTIDTGKGIIGLLNPFD